jgi:hypothetical protein
MSFVIDPNNPPPTPDGMSKGLEPRPVAYGNLSFAAPWAVSPLTPAELKEQIAFQKANKTGLIARSKSAGVGIKSQARTNYCWAFGTIRMVELTRLQMGEEHVPLSPASVACLIKNYSNRGGWGGECLEGIAKWGIAPESLWPQAAIDRKYDNAESREARKAFNVMDFVDVPEDFYAVMTLLVRGLPCGVAFNWWGHLVCAVEADVVNGQLGYWVDNSWNTTWGTGGRGFITGSKADPSEAYSVLVPTAA